MNLEKYKQLIDQNLENQKVKNELKEMNKEILNNESNIKFINTEKFKSITDKIESKNNELIGDIKSLAPSYNMLDNIRSELKMIDFKDEDEDKDKLKNLILNVKNDFNDDEINFLDKIYNKEKILIPGKTNEYFNYIDIIALDDIIKSSINDLENLLENNPFKTIQSKLGALKRNLTMKSEDYHNVILYNNAINNYKSAIKNMIQSSRYVGHGIKKKRNGYKIDRNGLYNNKVYINTDKLLNEFILEVMMNNEIIYKTKADKATVDILTKRFDNSKKYTKKAIKIFNDLNTITNMKRKKGNKMNKFIGNSIILNENDKIDRLNLLHSALLSGNDSKIIYDEIEKINGSSFDENKNVDDLYNELKQLTPMISSGSQNVINSIYNIIDYLRKNNEISKEQYHKYIKKYLIK